jgi:hypothetical protein
MKITLARINMQIISLPYRGNKIIAPEAMLRIWIQPDPQAPGTRVQTSIHNLVLFSHPDPTGRWKILENISRLIKLYREKGTRRNKIG